MSHPVVFLKEITTTPGKPGKLPWPGALRLAVLALYGCTAFTLAGTAVASEKQKGGRSSLDET